MSTRPPTPPPPSAYTYLGVCRSEEQKFPEAITAFRRALELKTKSSERADLHVRLGYAYHQAGQPKRASAEYERAKREPDAGPYRRTGLQSQIFLAEQINDSKQLRKLCEEHVREFPDDDTMPQVERFKKERR